MEKKKTVNMEEVVALCKRRGFIYPGSEIYGGLANTWDYGPYGVELKNNIKSYWWQKFVRTRDDVVGLDAAILMNPLVWEASGHIKGFSDPLVECKKCHNRFRADHLVEEKLQMETASLDLKELSEIIRENSLKCPKCEGEITGAREFNLMFKTSQGVVEEKANLIYLRPETAGGIFVNFKNIMDTMRVKLPFGVAQIGKSFRNEITPGNFTYRTREFEQMEIEYFVRPGEEKEAFAKFKKLCMEYFVMMGVSKKKLRFRDHEQDELAHYANFCTDVEYKYPFGWGELCGLASRTDYDLKQHSSYSGVTLTYFDDQKNERFTPYVVEPSFGADRSVLVVLVDAYTEEDVDGEKRVLMKFAPGVAPVKVAVLPLVRKSELFAVSRPIYEELREYFNCEYDVSGTIGKRYRRQDEIGTPYCVTVDFDSVDDGTVTVRDRDSMEQERVKADDLLDYFRKKLNI